MRTHTNTQFKSVSTLSQIQVTSGPRAHQPALLLTAIATFLAIVGLSSCAGYTSAAKTGPGTTTGAGVLSASTTTLSFGDVAVANSATQTLTVTNSGTGTVDISQATLSGAAFSVVGGMPSGTLQVGQSASMQIQFSPTASGAASGTITINSDASDPTVAVALSGTGAQAGLSVSPASWSFGNTTVGQSNSANVKLTNTGNTSVTINVATVNGSAFGISGLSTPMTLTAGQSMNFNAQFTPTANGASNGSISFTDNAPNSPQSFTMSGTGVATSSTLAASPASLTFGNVNVGSNGQQTVTLTNSGNASATISSISATGTGFSVTGLSTPVTVAANQSVNFTAQFAPTATGNVSGAITVSSSANNSTLSIPVSGSGIQGSLISNPGAVTFGNVNVGSSGSSTVTLTNSGSATINISQASVSGTGFTITGLATPATISAGQSTSFTAKFAPTTSGSATGNISITSNAPNSPLSISLTGNGVASQPQLTVTPGSVNFGSTGVGASSSATVSLSNQGNATLTVSQISASGSGFSVSGAGTPINIAPNATASFTATFAPTTGGAATGSISIVSNAPGSPASVTLSGTGTQAQLGASPTNIPFGSVAVGSNGTQTVTLTNSGSASVTISQASATGSGFTITGISTPLNLGAGQSTSFTAQFAPTTGGNASGTISIISNAPNSPLNIAMSGAGTQPQISATPSSAAFGNVSTGTNNTQTITISNGGSGSLTISSVNVTGAGFSFTGISAPVTIAAGKNASFNAVFAPTSAGAVSGSITIANNSPTPSINIPLSGTGIASTKSLSLSTSSLSFGNVNVGSSNSLSVAVTNTGNANVTISNVATSGAGFSVTGVSNGETLTPNQSITVTVQFAPTTGGAVTGSVVLSSDASNSPATIATSGTGVASTPHTVALNWTASTGSNISGYNVYRGTTANGPYPTKVNTSGLVDAVQFTDNAVTSGTTYYYVVTAVDSSNDESAFSNQASAIIP
jgi:Abnormal spindle-like microcephaly-assoc'd, ASPM-SPD-2-Hydin